VPPSSWFTYSLPPCPTYNVRDDLPGTAGTPGAAEPSTQSDSSVGLGQSLVGLLAIEGLNKGIAEVMDLLKKWSRDF